MIIFFIVSILTIEGIKLKTSVYVDGSGGWNSGFGFFVKETGESFYEKKSEIINNQAEYMAIILALKKNLLRPMMKLLFTVIQKIL